MVYNIYLHLVEVYGFHVGKLIPVPWMRHGFGGDYTVYTTNAHHLVCFGFAIGSLGLVEKTFRILEAKHLR